MFQKFIELFYETIGMSAFGNVEKERELYHQISSLQLKMHNFNQQSSPVKSRTDMVEDNNKETAEIIQPKGKLHNAFLIPITCIASLYLFPTLVFCIEGYCPLFWKAIVVASALAAILVIISVVHHHTNFLDKMTKGTQSRVKIIIQDIDSENAKRTCHFISIAIVLLAVLGLGTWGCLANMPVLFNVSIATGSFICGILSVKLYNFCTTSDLLPTISPFRKKNVIVVKSPASRRELDFTMMNTRNPSSLTPLKYFSLLNEASEEDILLDAELLGVAPLPVTLTSPLREPPLKMPDTSPHVFGYF